MLMQYGLFRRNIPHQALKLITDTLPLHLQIKKLMTEAAVRNPRFLDNSATTSRYLLTLLTDSNFPTNSDQIDQILTIQIKENKTNHIISDGLPDQMELEEKNNLIVFTDGSKLEEKIGSGWVVQGDGVNIISNCGLPGYSTVFNAEITAIIKAAEAIMTIPEKEFARCIFHVDSQSAIKALVGKKN